MSELRGRRVGVTPRTSSEFFFTLFAAEHGLSRDEVTVVEDGQSELAERLLSGDLDADGQQDLIVALVAPGGTHSLEFLRGRGDGTFFPTVPIKVDGIDPVFVAAAELNGAAGLELAVINEATSDLTTLNNGGTGTFSAGATLATGARPASVIAAPIDAAVSANILSPGSTSIALADQNSVIVQTLQGVANASGTQASTIDQGESTVVGGGS